MGYLVTVLLSFLVDFFGKKFVSTSLRIAVMLAFVAFIVAAIFAYLGFASALITGIGRTVPDVVVGVWGWVMPSNTNACLVAVSSVRLLKFFTYHYFKIMDARYRALIS